MYLKVSHHYQPHGNALGSSVDGAIIIATHALFSFLVERGTIDVANKYMTGHFLALKNKFKTIRSINVNIEYASILNIISNI